MLGREPRREPAGSAGAWGCIVMVVGALAVIALIACLAYGITQGQHAR